MGITPSMKVVYIAEKVLSRGGGGTWMELPVGKSIEGRKILDNLLLITDSKEWGRGWLNYNRIHILKAEAEKKE